jgi:hypothetical protein
MVLVGQKIISKITQEDVEAVNYLMGLLPDLYRWRAEAESGAKPSAIAAIGSRSALLPAEMVMSASVPLFGGDVSLVWIPEVPLFNLLGMYGKDGLSRLTLERAGRVQSGGDDVFFAFTPIPEGTGNAGFATGSTLPPLESKGIEKRVVDGVALSLDGRWTMIADNTYLMGNSAIIIVDTLDLALMQIPSDHLPLSLARLFSLSSGTSYLLPRSFSLSGTASAFRISNVAYDVQTGIFNRDIKYCVVSKDKKKCVVVSLTVNEAAYSANRPYFDVLF